MARVNGPPALAGASSPIHSLSQTPTAVEEQRVTDPSTSIDAIIFELASADSVEQCESLLEAVISLAHAHPSVARRDELLAACSRACLRFATDSMDVAHGVRLRTRVFSEPERIWLENSLVDDARPSPPSKENSPRGRDPEGTCTCRR